MVQTFTWLLIYQTDEILWSGERGIAEVSGAEVANFSRLVALRGAY